MATYKSIKYIIPTEAVEHTDSINALADVDTTTVAPSVGQTLKWSAANSRWQPADLEESASGTQKAIFGFGDTNVAGNRFSNLTNIVSSTGIVATDTTGVGTARDYLAASGYGGDKSIFGFGFASGSPSSTNVTNLVSNTGVVASDQTGVGTARGTLAAAGFGGDKAIFGFGGDNETTNVTNLVSNTGVVSSDTTGVGTVRGVLAAASYGGDKALFGFGYDDVSYTYIYYTLTNLVSNTGVVATDTSTVSGVTGRQGVSAAGFGGDKAIFGFGNNENDGFINISNLVSSTGIVATDTTGVGTAREGLAASGYGNDKAIFGFGSTPNTRYNMTNLVSNTGVVATDTTGVGTARSSLAAAGYSTTA